MEDEELDLDALTELLSADDPEVAPETLTSDLKDNKNELEKELEAMRQRVKLLEKELQNKSVGNSQIKNEVPKSQPIPPPQQQQQQQKRMENPPGTKHPQKITPKVKKLDLVKEDIFGAAYNSDTIKESVDEPSLVHNGDTDSSDDEEKRNGMTSSLNNFGRAVKKKLIESQRQYNDSRGFQRMNPKSSFQATGTSKESLKSPKTLEQSETDPFSGLRIINPLVSSQVLRERMVGRKMIKLSLIHNHIRCGDIEGDWVTIGVIINRGEPKTSKNGKTFCIWKINDLQNLENSVSLFLFGDVHKNLWKTSLGSVVGLLNPKIMPNREGDKTGNVCLTVDHPGKVMLIGQSKDFGTCKGKKKDGGSCHNLVNKKECEFCVYHIQREYKKAGRRMDLQSSFSGVEPKGLRNPSIKSKILNKNGVMYGGQLYTVPLGKPNQSQRKQKDQLTLTSLKLKQKAQEVEDATRKTVAVKHLTEKENQVVNGVLTNSEFLGSMLTLPTAGSRNLIKHLVKEEKDVKENQGIIKSVTPRELLDMHKKSLENLKRKRSQLEESSSPKPSRQIKLARVSTGSGLELDLELTDGASSGTFDVAKMRALAKLAQKPIKKEDPNSVRKKKLISPEQTERILKRVEQNSSEADGMPQHVNENGSSSDLTAKDKLQSRLGEMSKETIERIMKMKSSHSYEVDEEEASRLNVYFKNLEKKEQLENKMQTVTEITCTVISCKICKYTSQHPSELCVKENHFLRRHKAQKRFFKCVQCKHRTFAFTKLPTKACRNCGSESFEKTAMMKPKQGPKLDNEQLLIRGEEIKFIK